MDHDERTRLIAQYRDGYSAIAEALLKITPEEMDSRPGPNRWSTREIVHHLADSEMTAAVRLRRLHYDRPHETDLQLFKYVREATAELIERMEPAEWLREGTHNEVGRYTPETWLTIYAVHAHKHALQIRAVRDAARKQTV